MKVYFIRHGETVWNTLKIFQGIKNSPLTELGKEQTKRLKNYLKDIEFTHFYSSPLGRALETINILTEDIKNPKIEIIPDFREINMGNMEEFREMILKQLILWNSIIFGITEKSTTLPHLKEKLLKVCTKELKTV